MQHPSMASRPQLAAQIFLYLKSALADIFFQIKNQVYAFTVGRVYDHAALALLLHINMNV